MTSSGKDRSVRAGLRKGHQLVEICALVVDLYHICKIFEIVCVQSGAGGKGVFVQIVLGAVRHPETLGDLCRFSVFPEFIRMPRHRVEHESKGRSYEGVVFPYDVLKRTRISEQLKVPCVVAVDYAERRFSRYGMILLGHAFFFPRGPSKGSPEMKQNR